MPQSQKTLEFLQKLKDKGHWNDDYDYSEVEYVTAKHKVLVKNKKYNSSHIISPDSLLRGSPCALNNSIDKLSFCLQLFSEVHGSKYNYSKFVYSSNLKKGIIICHKHGEFLLAPGRHIYRKTGCPKCSNNSRINIEELLKEYNEVHNNKYDYSLFKYNGSSGKVKIICPTHGVFEQSSYSHKKIGCPKCSGRARLTSKEFISRSKKVFHDTYQYKKAKYVNQKTKIVITCKVHGDFSMLPHNHFRLKQGCPKCKGYNKTTNQIIEDFKKVHGEEYDYSKINYVNSNTKLVIICKTHGEFKQTYTNHLKSKGCKKCSGSMPYNKKTTLLAFREIHGDRYDYSKIEFVNSKTKVKIICSSHGGFIQSPEVHFRGAGCPKCAGKNLTTEEVIADFQKIHGNTYDYSKVNYSKTLVPVEIICSTHGVFKQLRNNHLKGQGCPKCGIIKNALNQRLSLEEFIEKSIKVHGDRYNYSKVNYQNNTKKVIIYCQLHGDFSQSPAGHMSGKGCPTCNSGWNNERVINFINDIRNEDI